MTRRRMPSLIALRAFEAVARTGSVRAAGDELAVSHTVVSRHVQNLQKALSVSLLRAEGRGVAVTEAGLALHTEIAQAFDIIERATAFARPLSRLSLKIWCTPGVANRRLLFRLTELTGPPRNWEVNMQPTLSRPNLSRAEADAEIVYSEATESRPFLMAEALVRPRVFAVASPAYLARHPSIANLADLSRAALIHEESTQQWERWFKLAGGTDILADHGQRLWHAHLTIEAARLGQGVALANDILVEEDLRSGALVEVIPTQVYMGTYQLVALKERWTDPTIVAFRDWLRVTLANRLVPERHRSEQTS